MRELFAADPQRFAKMSREACGLFVDYSKHRTTDETLQLLFALAKQAEGRGLARQDVRRREDQRHRGPRRAAHRAAQPREPPVLVDGKDVMPEVNARARARCATSPSACASGAWKGHTGKTITDVVNIGIGGSDLGPVMVDRGAAAVLASADLHVHFVSNVDGTHIAETLQARSIRSARCSSSRRKTFTTQETLTNAQHRARVAARASSATSRRRREALRRAVDQREGGRRVRHRHREHVRVLGLGRRPLLAVVGDRPVDRAA